MFFLGPCLLACVVAVSTLPPPAAPGLAPQQQFATDFVDAVTSLDLTTASQLFDHILAHGHMDASAFTLANALKRAMMLKMLSVDSKLNLENLRDRLPISVRNVVFADTVCFLNGERFRYMFSPSNDYIFDAESRNVFMWNPNTAAEGRNWTLEPTLTPTDYKIVNEYGEYLFADESHYYFNRRQIFTYIPSVWTGFSTNVWSFIPLGDDTIIQNTWFAAGVEGKEYLYSPSNVYNYDANRGRVFSWDNAWTPGDNSHIWHVAAC